MAQLQNLLVTGDSRFLNEINGKIDWSNVLSKPTIPTVTDTYSATGTAATSGKAVAAALGTLDGTVSGTAGAGKTLTAFSQTDGKVSATFGNISITKSQVSDFPTLGTAAAKDVPSSGNASTTQVVMGNDTRLSNARTPSSHTHGNIQNGGTLQTNDITIASGDKLVVTDSSDSSKVARTSISFDGSTANKCLTQKGTWESFTNNTGTITSVKTTAGAHTTINVTSGAANFNVPTKTSHLTNDSGFVTTDTKNTAGSTDTSSKLFLIGATSQTASSQTYSQDTAYVGTDGCLYSHDTKVLTEADSPEFIGDIACSNGTIDVSKSAVSGSPGTYTVNVQPWLVTDYGECNTAAATAAKVVTVTSNSFNLYSGVTVRIKFDYTNTASAPTLNVNSTGAKNIVKWGTTAVGTSTSTSWTAGSVVSFTYDGTSWVMNDHIDDTNTNNAVLQSPTTTDNNFEVLFSHSANNTAETAGVGKNDRFLYDPYIAAITIGDRKSNSVLGVRSFAQGASVEASGENSHAEGYYTVASGYYSHTEGRYTTASRRSHHVFGEYNIADSQGSNENARGAYVEIVGNGTSTTDLSNARTLDWSGNQWIAGNYSDTNGLLAMKEVTQAQYDALTTAEKNNGTAYFITDRLSPAATDLWTKVGTGTLTTTAKDCSGAINELNANITNVRAAFELMSSNNINNTTATAFNLNGKLSDYHYLCIQLRNYNNVLQTQFLGSSYFQLTSSGTRPMFYVYTNKYIGCIEVYYKSDTSVYIKASSGNTFTSNYRVVINGYEHKK